jgi:hypothetical protein
VSAGQWKLGQSPYGSHNASRRAPSYDIHRAANSGERSPASATNSVSRPGFQSSPWLFQHFLMPILPLPALLLKISSKPIIRGCSSVKITFLLNVLFLKRLVLTTRHTFVETFWVPHPGAETIRTLRGVDFKSGGLLLQPLIIYLPLLFLPKAAA